MSLASDIKPEESAVRWAAELGLAISPLFALGSSEFGDHFALLDGRRGSFAWSSTSDAHGVAAEIDPEKSVGWRWSADLAHHLLLTPSDVTVFTGYDEIRRFARQTVERSLPDFFRYLDTPRRRSLPDVVPFLVEEFLQIWSTLPQGDRSGSRALAQFILALIAAGEANPEIVTDSAWRVRTAAALGLEESHEVAAGPISSDTIDRVLGMRSRVPLGLTLNPALVLRHAAGRLFQEAHAYIESAQLGLFGDAEIRTIPTFSPSGAYFTPVPIARLVAESALLQFDVLPPRLDIADYACGSAVFLTEALRALERRRYKGDVRLIGRDISPEAITMARVAIATAARDLTEIRVVADLREADATGGEAWPPADVVLMNPPFRSWEQMAMSDRDWVRASLRQTRTGRPDLSVGFIARALDSLRPNGVIASLVPAGVLASEGLAPWRASLLERATPKLLAVLGEHGLFRHAIVNVGVMVLAEGSNKSGSTLLSWSAAEQGASSSALRAVRKAITRGSLGYPETRMPTRGENQWSVSTLPLGVLRDRPTWLPGANAIGSLLAELQATTQTTVEDLFDVHQGVRTGAKGVFLQSASFVAGLPSRERRWFRQAVTTDSFVDGQIQGTHYLFEPDPEWVSEEAVRAACPRYFAEVLQHHKNALSARKGIPAGKWWQLTRRRGWSHAALPRLVSKRFGLLPAFARDLAAEYAVVQANAWLPTTALRKAVESDALPALLTAYWWFLNSQVAVALFREYCPNVAGGQLDLEHKYVRHVIFPNLATACVANPRLQDIMIEIRSKHGDSLPPIIDRDRFAAMAFGTDVLDWPIAARPNKSLR